MRTEGMEQRYLKSLHNMFWAHFSFPELQALIIHSSGGWCFPEKRRESFIRDVFFPPQNLPKKRSFRLFLLLATSQKICVVFPGWLWRVRSKKARWEQGGHPKCHQFNENSMEVFKLHSLFNKWEQKEKICDGYPTVSIIRWVLRSYHRFNLKAKNGMERQQNNCTVLCTSVFITWTRFCRWTISHADQFVDWNPSLQAYT